MKEATDILANHNIIVKSLSNINLPEIQTLSVELVIKEKLNEAKKFIGTQINLGPDEYIIVDDTGLEIEAFNNKEPSKKENSAEAYAKLPGALIKFFMARMTLKKLRKCLKIQKHLSLHGSVLWIIKGIRIFLKDVMMEKYY